MKNRSVMYPVPPSSKYYSFMDLKLVYQYVRRVYTPRFCLITTKVWSDGH